MEKKDVFTKGADKTIEVGDRLSEFTETFLTNLLLIFIIVALGFISFYTLIPKNTLDKTTILNTIVLILANTAGFTLFNPKGKKTEQKRNKSYQENAKTWSSLSSKVQNEKPREFRDFCKEQTEEKRRNIIDNYVRNALIEKDYFNEKIKPLNNDEFKTLIKSKNEYGRLIYSKKQIKYLKKARNIEKIKVKNIDPNIILLGVNSNSNYEVGQKETITVDQKIFINRILKIIVYTLLLSLVGIVPTETVNLWTALGVYLIRITNILTSAVIGMYAGIKSVRARNNRIKLNIFFLKLFNKKDN